jgi:hypothetical protein
MVLKVGMCKKSVLATIIFICFISMFCSYGLKILASDNVTKPSTGVTNVIDVNVAVVIGVMLSIFSAVIGAVFNYTVYSNQFQKKEACAAIRKERDGKCETLRVNCKEKLQIAGDSTDSSLSELNKKMDDITNNLKAQARRLNRQNLAIQRIADKLEVNVDLQMLGDMDSI